MAAYFVECAAWAKSNVCRDGARIPVLTGDRGSLASSLDMALAKKPEWLADIFGSGPDGSPLLLECVRRTNPGRKRAGPVTIQLACDFLPPQNISVFAKNRLIENPQDLEELSARIAEQRKGKGPAEEPPNAIEGPPPGPEASGAPAPLDGESAADLSSREGPFRLAFLPNNIVEVHLPTRLTECPPKQLSVLLEALKGVAGLTSDIWVIERSSDRAESTEHDGSDDRKLGGGTRNEPRV